MAKKKNALSKKIKDILLRSEQCIPIANVKKGILIDDIKAHESDHIIEPHFVVLRSGKKLTPCILLPTNIGKEKYIGFWKTIDAKLKKLCKFRKLRQNDRRYSDRDLAARFQYKYNKKSYQDIFIISKKSPYLAKFDSREAVIKAIKRLDKSIDDGTLLL